MTKESSRESIEADMKDTDDPYTPNNPFIIPNNNRIYRNRFKHKIARDMLERYTGSAPEKFEKQIILTNFDYYLERFHNLCGDSRTEGSAMAAVHSKKAGVSVVDFSIGSPTAALIIELLGDAGSSCSSIARDVRWTSSIAQSR